MLNRTSLPSDVIAFVVFCRLRYPLTLRDLSEILLLRGIEVSHEAIRDWETKLLPIMGEQLRKRRHGKRRGPGVSWYVDETYLKVRGKWAYLYRAVDRDGNLIDAMLSEHRDMAAAKAFFRSAKATTGFRPDRVTTDGHGCYPQGSPHDARTDGPAPDQRLFKQPARAGPSRHQGADPMYARLQVRSGRRALLP